MKLLLQALILTSLSVSLTTASGDVLETPTGQSTGGLIPTTPVKQENTHDQSDELGEVNYSLLAEFEAVAADPESYDENNAVSDSDYE